jgi:hypothetical protein
MRSANARTLYVEFVDGFGVMLDLGERQFLAQLVALWGVSKTTAARWIAAGRGPAGQSSPVV